MSSNEVEVVVVGGGQAGLAMSEHLSVAGVPHVVLERHRIAERWRSERWDSLVANGPAWHDRFPGLEFRDVAPDGFASKDQVADYFVAYAKKIDAPMRCGVEVRSVRRQAGHDGFIIETSGVETLGVETSEVETLGVETSEVETLGVETSEVETLGVGTSAVQTYHARYVVAATGPFQRPVIPQIVAEDAALVQLHSNAYRNPGQLPAGAVLVVGAGSSGVQIADELQRSGRRVFLSVGPHDRPPRSYRGRDFCWWLGVLLKWDATTPPQGAGHVTIAVSGARGGHTVDFRNLAASGVELLGMTASYAAGMMRFQSDLGENIARGDASYLSLLDEADAYVERNGLDLPEEPAARLIGPEPESVTNPRRELDLAEAGVTSIIWATGYATDYSWLQADVFDELGRPQHQRGVTAERGVYFLGLPWLSRRGSSFIWGVWHDARYVAEHITTQRRYHSYRSERPTGQALPDYVASMVGSQ